MSHRRIWFTGSTVLVMVLAMTSTASAQTADTTGQRPPPVTVTGGPTPLPTTTPPTTAPSEPTDPGSQSGDSPVTLTPAPTVAPRTTAATPAATTAATTAAATSTGAPVDERGVATPEPAPVATAAPTPPASVLGATLERHAFGNRRGEAAAPPNCEGECGAIAVRVDPSGTSVAVLALLGALAAALASFGYERRRKLAAVAAA